MKRKYVVAGPGLVAVLAITSTALGGPSLKQLVKKEVAKQLANKTGPQGAQGAQGVQGANGADGANGSARAYAMVDHFLCNGSSPFSCGTGAGGLSKGVTAINETSATSGIYCVNAPGLSPATAPAVATVEFGESSAATHLVLWNSQNNSCTSPLYEFRTFDNAGAASDNVSFSFVIP